MLFPQAATSDLDKARTQAATASRDAEAASKREAQAYRSAGTQSTHLRKRCGQLLAALQALGRLALQSATAMRAAATAVRDAADADGAIGGDDGDGGSDWRSVPTDAIAEMVSLSMDEVQDLLGDGPASTAAGGASAGAGRRSSQQGPGESTAKLQQRLEELLLALQASLAQPSPAEAGSRDSSSRSAGLQAPDVAGPVASGADQQQGAWPPAAAAAAAAAGSDKAAGGAAERLWDGAAGMSAVLAALQKEVETAQTVLCRATAACAAHSDRHDHALVAVF